MPQNRFCGRNFKNLSPESESASLRYYVHQFSDKTDNFGLKYAQKWTLGSEFQKSNPGFGISILEILCVQIFRQNKQFWFFGGKFILVSQFQKSKFAFGINTSDILCVPIFSQNGQLLIFRPKFGEIAQLRAIFWFKYCWGCYTELGGGWKEPGEGGWSWVEVEMSWVEVDRAWWSWVVLGGGGCTVILV